MGRGAVLMVRGSEYPSRHERCAEPMTIAAAVAIGLLAILAMLQLALALGAPLGVAAWGGGHPGILPRRLRIASAVAGVLVYPIIGLVSS